ncbi:MAG: ABC transporter ATP-binding protein [Clostridia bacterium]|nr:ABC transporter ATP-binding protein [Clostridia bacterium]
MKIELRGVCFGYNNKNPLIDDFNCTFESGKCYCLKGRNGCGKTTLTKLILRLLVAQSGEIVIDNENIKKMSVAEISQNVGYLFQNPELQLFAPTVKEELSFPFELNKTLTQETEVRIEETLRQFGLTELKNSFPLLLSGGEKQRLALATIFVRDIKFLILDEPSSSIDCEGKQFLSELIADFVRSGGGVLVISHDEEFVALLDNPEMLWLGEAE